ncbi:MAG: 30S ribosomal protein S6, partial [Planctomycetota bacterium]
MKEREGEYIITFVFNYGFAAEGIDKVKAYIEDVLKKYRGSVLKIYILGERKFAYPIKHQQTGYYVFAQCKIPRPQIRFFRKDMELSENIVLRFLILRKEYA